MTLRHRQRYRRASSPGQLDRSDHRQVYPKPPRATKSAILASTRSGKTADHARESSKSYLKGTYAASGHLRMCRRAPKAVAAHPEPPKDETMNIEQKRLAECTVTPRMEEKGTLFKRTAVGNGPRRLQPEWQRPGLLPTRPRPQPRIPLGQGRHRGVFRRQPDSVLVSGAAE